MPQLLARFVAETANVFYEGSLFILVGFVVAGLLHEFLPTQLIARHLGSDSPRSVVMAALFGAPIPLCSCGVLPSAVALRDKGASRSSLLSFLISTPETGVDSIALSWGLLGPIMAIVRPVVAIVTAIVAGLLSILTGAREPEPPPATTDAGHETHDHASPAAAKTATEPEAGHAAQRLAPRARAALRYGFGPLLDDIAFWLVAGVLLTGLLSALLPDDFFKEILGWDRGILPMLLMVAIGVPLYLCASASTPVAAALIGKGLSPGAALVFLLVGPATNAASMAVVGHLLGRRALRIYLGSIVAVSIAAGLLLDAFAADAVIASVGTGGIARDPGPLAVLKLAAAVVFVVQIGLSFRRTRFREGWRDSRDQFRRLAAALAGFRLRRLVSGPALGGFALLAALVLLPDAFLVVGPGQRGIVQRFGRVVRSDLGPGLHLKWPAPLGTAQVVDVDLVREVALGYRPGDMSTPIGLVEQAYYLSADENLIDIRAVVHYRVRDAIRFALGAEQPDAVIAAAARRELVAVAAGAPIDAVYATERDATERAFRDALTAAVLGLPIGCELVDARLLDVHAPADVHDAFRDIASALEDQKRVIHEATGEAIERRTLAGGEAAAIIGAARADRTRAVAAARGATAPFAALAAAHTGTERVTETRLYLEALERTLPAVRKYIHTAGARRGDIDLWIGAAGSVAGSAAVPLAGAIAPPDLAAGAAPTIDATRPVSPTVPTTFRERGRP